MATYTVDSVNSATESTLIAYHSARLRTQQAAADMYMAIQYAEQAYTDLSGDLEQGGRFAELGDYHAALSEPLAESLAALRSAMAEITALMQAMQSAYPPGAQPFPGVPRG